MYVCTYIYICDLQILYIGVQSTIEHSPGKGKHDANEMKRLLMPHMLDDDDITIEVMVIHYKKDIVCP